MTPCHGKHELFDSRDYRDHVEAKKLCDQCPAVLACFRNLQEVINSPANLGGSPEGTWAGQLLGESDRSTTRRTKEKRAS